MGEPLNHAGCREFIREAAAQLGADVVVSTAPPLVEGPYGVNSYRCPHGVEYFIEPSGEQIAAWVRDGTP